MELEEIYKGVQWWNVPQKFPLILMKLRDLVVIGIIKMCTKFWQKNYQEVPLLGAKLCLKIYIKNPMG